MPRYRLRTLLILLAIGPPMLAGAWYVAAKYWRYQQTYNVFKSKDGIHAVRVEAP